MAIDVRIDRLVIDGLALSPEQQPLLRRALETELARLLAAGGLGSEWRSGGAVPSVRAGALHVAEGAEPARLGHEIARAVYQGVGDQPPSRGPDQSRRA